MVGSLEAGTTYYYKAYIREWDAATDSWQYRNASNVISFTTAAADTEVPGGWLELPAYSLAGMSGTTTSSLSDLYPLAHTVTVDGRKQRNYSCLYDPEMYASYWVAYPLCYAHVHGSGRSDQWAYDPDVPSTRQTNLTNGAYGVSVTTPNYASNYYSRGHQIASADRNGIDDMCDQTFYMTNLTPQIQNGFNGGIWKNLEEAIRALVSSDTSSKDTVYVITGASFRKKTDGTEEITRITNSRDNKQIPVPNYYWKALLKVTRNGSTITGASTIGFWYPHQDLKDESFSDEKYLVSVNTLEEWTGFDLFANLPAHLASTAQSNTSWTAFRNF